MMRNCPVCGDMTCGCEECYDPFSISTVQRFGICRTCDADIGRRIKGNVTVPHPYEGISQTVRKPDQRVMLRVLMKLQEFSRAAV